MSKYILILQGSPRVKGNSNTLAGRLAEGVRESGAEVESAYLHGMHIRPCDGCNECVQTGVCVLKDDMQALYPKLLKAEAIVLASPIYWFTYSAQLKTCIDRWYALWNYQHEAFKGKPFGIILTYGDEDLYSSGGINAIHTMETMLRFLRAEVAGWVHGTANDEGDVLQQPELMEKAYRLGKKLTAE